MQDSHNINTTNKLLLNLSNLEYFGTTVTNKYYIRGASSTLVAAPSKGGRTPTASKQATRHETKDAVLLHS
jgi:hypothetical protein